jgi:hypothetical protein
VDDAPPLSVLRLELCAFFGRLAAEHFFDFGRVELLNAVFAPLAVRLRRRDRKRRALSGLQAHQPLVDSLNHLLGTDLDRQGRVLSVRLGVGQSGVFGYLLP